VKRSVPSAFLWVFLVWLLLLVSTGICIAGEYQVSRVVDGDTIIVKKGTTKLTIRLVGIDAPEVSHAKNQQGQPFSQQSTKHLAGLMLNKVVDIKSYGPDRYGRALGEVFLDGHNINLEMVKSGLAEVYRGTPAKGQNMEPYWKAEEDAKKAGKGMWVLGDKYVSPREWRKTHGN
jgi:endonuclease YncB( thermonuclease family)